MPVSTAGSSRHAAAPRWAHLAVTVRRDGGCRQGLADRHKALAESACSARNAGRAWSQIAVIVGLPTALTTRPEISTAQAANHRRWRPGAAVIEVLHLDGWSHVMARSFRVRLVAGRGPAGRQVCRLRRGRLAGLANPPIRRAPVDNYRPALGAVDRCFSGSTPAVSCLYDKRYDRPPGRRDQPGAG